MKPPHYRGSYHRRAAAVRAAAYADPATRCGRCGHTLNEGPHHRKRGEKWEAGHVHDGQVDGPLRAETRSCNRRAAAIATNHKKRNGKRRGDPHSRRW